MWFKKLRKRKLQSVLIFLIVLVCSMLMSSSMVIMTSLNKPYKDLIRECNPPKVKVNPFDMPIKDLEQVREKFESLELTEKAIIVNYHLLVEKTVCKNEILKGFFDLVEYNGEIHENIRLISGNKTEPKEDECLIAAAIANEYGIKLGDTITISNADNEIEYKVKAIYTDPFNMSLAFDSEILVSKIPDNLSTKQYISVFGQEDTKGNEIVDEYRENNGGILEGRAQTVEARVTNNSITEKILGGILLAVSFIILIVSGVMIRYMIRNALLCDKKTIAIFKMIGYTNGNMISMYMKLYLLLVASGSLVGSWASFLISQSFMDQAYQNMGQVEKTSVMIPGLICISIIVMFVLSQVYAVLTKMKNIKPVIVLNGKEGEMGKKKTKRNAFSEKLSFSPLGMAIRMLQRDKKNTSYIVLTCIVSIYCVNFALTCFSLILSMKDNNYYWLGFDKHDVSVVSIMPSKFDQVVEELKREKGTEKIVLSTTDVGVMVPWKKGIGDTIVPAMLYETFDNLNMPVINGRNPKYSNEIVLSSLVMKEMKKNIGDYIDIYLDVNKKDSLLITGTYQSFYNMGRGCRLLGSTLTENGVEFKYNEASIYLEEGIDKETYIAKNGEKYKDTLEIIARKDKYGTILDMICDPQLKAIAPFMILAILLGAMNVVAIVYLKNIDNTKINSIYKCIGYSSMHLLKGNLLYVGMVAAVSMLITIPVFIFVFPKMMILSLSMFGFEEYLVTYNTLHMVIGNIGIFFVFLISTVLSSRNLFQNNISDLNQD